MKRVDSIRHVTTQHIGAKRETLSRRLVDGQLVVSTPMAATREIKDLKALPDLTDAAIKDACKEQSTLRGLMAQLGLWGADSFASAIAFKGGAQQAVDLLRRLSEKGFRHVHESGSAGVTIHGVTGKSGRGFIAPLNVMEFAVADSGETVIALEAMTGVTVRHVEGGLARTTPQAALDLLGGRIFTEEEAMGTPKRWAKADRERAVSLARDLIMVLPETRRDVEKGLDFNVLFVSQTPYHEPHAQLAANGIRGLIMSQKEDLGAARAVIDAIGRQSGFKGHTRDHLAVSAAHWSPAAQCHPHREDVVIYEAVASSTLQAARAARFEAEGGIAGARERLIAFLRTGEPKAAEIVAQAGT